MKPRKINMYLNLVPAFSGCEAVFRLVKPGTAAVSKSLLTDAQGAAVAQFSLGSRYTRGTYQGSVTVTVTGQTLKEMAQVVI